MPIAAAKVDCPHCKGNGQLMCDVPAWDEQGRTTEGRQMLALTCVTCDGAKLVTAERAAAYVRFLEMWCRCEDSPGSSYVPDTASMKHHWTCQACGKVTQIG